ncbi:hypothetical protein F441_08640 [Phytophthora nicotianae CJ01A1]|uniref:Uncharacterized protein n=5 Tax=Phytophthora nicotianae TaxID=4792 RepID=V9F6A2_PHYNI|nr:hypothetical protein F443_08663 [Phytophthora nicotianae P1569]ETK86988.1 hypothetical protein L915_08497 [Phytophthora nicotianae]ETP16851.1 hypothetical protein F441_08640 [Phytophthora nicotianae CJ01A1]ETP44908.1 hypothetical protein F442_08595 [Phytophthora nicotianae P10297]
MPQRLAILARLSRPINLQHAAVMKDSFIDAQRTKTPPATAPTAACKTSLTIATSCETITAPSKTYLFKSIL